MRYILRLPKFSQRIVEEIKEDEIGGVPCKERKAYRILMRICEKKRSWDKQIHCWNKNKILKLCEGYRLDLCHLG
jgi:hypothetical protein